MVAAASEAGMVWQWGLLIETHFLPKNGPNADRTSLYNLRPQLKVLILRSM